MQRYLKRAIELISSLALTKEKNPTIIPPHHTKNRVSAPEARYFRRAGKLGGISPRILSHMLRALEAEPRANIHNLMLIKDGKLVLECSAPGYDTNTFHLSHSMSKTVTGIAIGFLAEEYGIDVSQRVLDFFPDITPEDKRFSEMTIEHLLAMRSGVPFSELGTATETEWTATFFASELSFTPGEKFHYNSLNSYILAKIVTVVSGMSLVDFLTPRLFKPLHIENFLWECSPEGVEKGGFGLYMSAESWSKIGYMMLSMGEFEGKQIVPRNWILRSITERSIAPEQLGAFNYGYHIWVGRNNDEFLLNGMLGQNVWVCPKNNIVLALNCGNGELFQGSPALDIVRAHLGGALESVKPTHKDLRELDELRRGFFSRRHQVRPKAPMHGLSYAMHLRSPFPFDSEWEPMLGEYAFPDNNSGLLPLFVSTMQNNFCGGIEKMSFERRGNSLWFSCTEGGIVREFELGIYSFKTTTLTWGGETYIVNAMAEALEDEDRNPVYKLALIYPELPNSRLIKFWREGSRLRVKMSELPNEKFAESYLSGFTKGGMAGFALGLLERKLGDDFLTRKLREVFNPELLAIRTDSPGWQDILLSENMAEREYIARTSGAVAALISRFVGEDKSEKEERAREKAKEKEERRAEKEEARAKEREQKQKAKEERRTDKSNDDTEDIAAPTDESAQKKKKKGLFSFLRSKKATPSEDVLPSNDGPASAAAEEIPALPAPADEAPQENNGNE